MQSFAERSRNRSVSKGSPLAITDPLTCLGESDRKGSIIVPLDLCHRHPDMPFFPGVEQATDSQDFRDRPGCTPHCLESHR